MGIILSTTRYAPFSFVTGIIGLVSFVFTLGTFFKVVYVNITTFTEAPHEVHAFLTNLRTELLEERASIRVMRKRCKQLHRQARKSGGEYGGHAPGMELDDVTLKTMGDTNRYLVRRFRALEKPFLAPGDEGIAAWEDHRHKRRDSSSSPYYEHGAYATTDVNDKDRHTNGERGRRRRERDAHEDETDDEAYRAQRTRYAKFTFGKRMIWIRKKSEAQNLFETLSRTQIRRCALQVAGIALLLQDHGRDISQLEDAVRRIDERTGRIVGVRRVD